MSAVESLLVSLGESKILLDLVRLRMIGDLKISLTLL